MSPLVSVLIPAYNASPFIGQAIESVLQQTMADLEVIVVDDASTDDTAALVSSIQDPRVRLLRNEENQHVARSRNRALDAARGEWVALLDADDWMLPSRFEQLLNAARTAGADIVADDIYFVPDGKTVDLDRGIEENRRGFARALPRLFATTDLPHWLTIENIVHERLPGGNDPRISLVKPLFRRAFLNENDIRYVDRKWSEEDVPFYLDCLGYGARFLLVEGPWYCYRTHPNMTSKGWDEADYRARVEVNDLLLTRPYVQSSPSHRHLLEQRRAKLHGELRAHLFAKRLDDGSPLDAVRWGLHAPGDCFHYLRREMRLEWGHRRAQMGNVPTRLRELVGRGTRMQSVSES